MAVTTMIEKAKSADTGQTPSDDLDLRARKRMEVGLAPTRPTAKAIPLRPPDYQALPLPPVLLALFLVGIVLVTAVLLAANLSGGLPSWWPTWTGLAATGNSSTAPPVNLPAQDYALRLADDFSQSNSPLMQGSRPNEWRTELLPAESVYAIEVSPNHLAWSLLGLTDLQGYRLQTSVLVSDQTPGGYAGLIIRYQDERHFYLLSVDGNGRYQIQQQDGDEVITVQPWVMAPFLNRAGSANLLTIEDDGSRVLFYGNNMLVAEISAPAYPLGFVGLAGGAQGQAVADIRFDWFQLYDAISASE
ncbi:MAG: hypothetical protein IT328_05180 [Caldilineaceae bacterium]|nr:hypothetical protein [Caldilineaceae bacterium]